MGLLERLRQCRDASLVLVLSEAQPNGARNRNRFCRVPAHPIAERQWRLRSVIEQTLSMKC